jgi:hypothetical protein
MVCQARAGVGQAPGLRLVGRQQQALHSETELDRSRLRGNSHGTWVAIIGSRTLETAYSEQLVKTAKTRQGRYLPRIYNFFQVPAL